MSLLYQSENFCFLGNCMNLYLISSWRAGNAASWQREKSITRNQINNVFGGEGLQEWEVGVRCMIQAVIWTACSNKIVSHEIKVLLSFPVSCIYSHPFSKQSVGLQILISASHFSFWVDWRWTWIDTMGLEKERTDGFCDGRSRNQILLCHSEEQSWAGVIVAQLNEYLIQMWLRWQKGRTALCGKEFSLPNVGCL